MARGKKGHGLVIKGKMHSGGKKRHKRGGKRRGRKGGRRK